MIGCLSRLNCNFSIEADFVHAPATELMTEMDLQYDDWLTAGRDLLSVVSFFIIIFNYFKLTKGVHGLCGESNGCDK